MGCSAPSPLPSPSRRGAAKDGDIPLFRGVSDRTGCSAPSPLPSPSRRGAAKDGDIPLFRGVSDRTGCSLPALLRWGLQTTPSGFTCHPFGEGEYSRAGRQDGCSLPASAWLGITDYPVRASPATPSEKGNLAPSPMPSHSGRGVGKGWGIFPSLEGWPTGQGVLRPHPYPLPEGEGWPKDGEYSSL